MILISHEFSLTGQAGALHQDIEAPWGAGGLMVWGHGNMHGFPHEALQWHFAAIGAPEQPEQRADWVAVQLSCCNAHKVSLPSMHACVFFFCACQGRKGKVDECLHQCHEEWLRDEFVLGACKVLPSSACDIAACMQIRWCNSLRSWKPPETEESKAAKAAERAEKAKRKKEKKEKEKTKDEVKSEDDEDSDEKKCLGLICCHCFRSQSCISFRAKKSKKEKKVWHAWHTHGIHDLALLSMHDRLLCNFGKTLVRWCYGKKSCASCFCVASNCFVWACACVTPCVHMFFRHWQASWMIQKARVIVSAHLCCYMCERYEYVAGQQVDEPSSKGSSWMQILETHA